VVRRRNTKRQCGLFDFHPATRLPVIARAGAG